ncbi:apolipoprotein N-acyltransferase [Kribbella sp. DT2]|uniref:apolipoprotein N-acyltransferase n=1 Tax=Kribbella sp. DT2 TaxID=3393427 RepID=UPI003CEA6BEE
MLWRARCSTADGRGPAVGNIPAAGLAVIAGLLLDVAFPGVGWWPLAPLAMAGLLLTFRGRGVRANTILGFLFGLAFFVPHVSWSGIFVGPVPWLALATLQALYLAGFGALATIARRCSSQATVRAVVVASVWVAVEALRSRTPFGGFPWGRLAFSQADAPTAGLAAMGGIPLISFAVALAGALLAEAAQVSRAAQYDARRGVVRPAFLATLSIAVLTVGLLVPTPTDGDRSVTVAAVQGNVPTAGLDFNAERRAVLNNHVRETQQLAAEVADERQARPDVVLWPENASDIDPLRDPDAADSISSAARAVGVPILVGTVLREPAENLSNVSLVWDPVSGPGQRYVKHRPVPFGEYVPYRAFFRQLSKQVDLIRADFVAGEGPNVLSLGPVKAGTAICFEVAFDDLLRDAVIGGADLLVVQTNNATFGRSDESTQQLAMSRLRAIEHGRAVAHISTVGISALIRPDGSVAQGSGHFTQETLAAPLPLRSQQTLATRVGQWPEFIVVIAALCGIALGLRRKHRRPAGAKSTASREPASGVTL